MSLKSQLTLFVLGLLLVVLGATFWINLDSTRAFLQQQLQTHAQDTATSLGVTLSHAVAPDDLASMETYINAVFDRGYYLEISLIDPEGKVLYQKKNPLKIEAIPPWFIQLIDLHPETASNEIISGWVPVGEIQVTSHPGYAYAQLWEAFVNAIIVFIMIAVLAVSTVFLYLNIVLEPLKKMVQQARAIVEKHYVVQKELPHTRELKEVVSAINSMVMKLKEIFTQEAKINARLQKMAYEDPVTHLGNRAYFDMVLDSVLSDESEPHAGSLAIVRLEQLQALNQAYGYPVVNTLIKELVQLLQERVMQRSGAVIARLNGSEFAILAPSTLPNTLEKLLHTVPEYFQQIQANHNVENPASTLHIGISYYLPEEQRPQVLMRANEALHQATREADHLHVVLPPADEKDSLFSLRVLSALEAGRIQLTVQPVFTLPEQTVHSLEVFAQLFDEEKQPLPAKAFLPIIAEEGLEAEFDRAVLEKVFHALAQTPSLPKLSVNLTQSMIEDLDQQAWLINQLKDSALACCLTFELPEHFLNRWPTECSLLSEKLRIAGCEVGLDHFGRQLGDKQFLQYLKPHYFKLAFGFGEALKNRDEKTSVYLASLVEIAQNQDITPIATGIEDKALVPLYEAIGVHIFQGYAFGAPQPLAEWIKTHANTAE